MKEPTPNRARCFSSLALSFLLVIPGIAGSERSKVKTTVLLYNYAEVPGAILEQAEKSAASVFHRAGIETSWRTVPLAPSEAGSERSTAQIGGDLTFHL